MTEQRTIQSRLFTVDLAYRNGLGAVPGRGVISPTVCAPGTSEVLVSMLLTVADNEAGWSITQSNLPHVSFTTDLSATVLRPPPVGEFRTDTVILHNGGVVGHAEVRFTGEGPGGAEAADKSEGERGGTPFAVVHGTWVRSPRPVDQLDALVLPDPRDGQPLSVPLADRCGCVPGDTGEVFVPHRPDLCNSGDSLHGGVHALAAESAALSLDSELTGAPTAAVALSVRYLRALRAGPMRAQATHLGSIAGMRRYRVECVDMGRDRRLCSVSMVSCLTPPR